MKFFRWAVDRLEGRDGIVCFVETAASSTNAFDGMRKHCKTFPHIYRRSARQWPKPKLSGTTHNVFGIQVGVGITVAVRRLGSNGFAISITVFPAGEEKLRWLPGDRILPVPYRRPGGIKLRIRRTEPDDGGTNKIPAPKCAGPVKSTSFVFAVVATCPIGRRLGRHFICPNLKTRACPHSRRTRRRLAHNRPAKRTVKR